MSAWDEYLRLNKPSIELCQDVKEIWEDTKNDEKEKKLTSRWNAVFEYQGGIKKLLGNDIKECSDLMDAFTSMTVEKYFETFSQLSEDYKPREEQANNIWYKCFHFICINYINVRVYEKERYEEPQKCNARILKMIKRQEECEDVFLSTGKWPEDDPDDIYGPNGAFTIYDTLCNKPEFKLCWRLFNLTYEDLVFLHESILLVTKVVLMCLYITLENEKKKIRKFAKIHGVTLPKLTEYDNETSAPQAKAETKTTKKKLTKATKQEEEDNTTLAEKKADKEWIQKVFTARANKYFANAINVGYMQETEMGYQWTFSNGLQIALAYFVRRIYQPGSPQYKKLEVLFGLPRKALKGSGYQLRHSPWFEDVLHRRKGVTKPPKWYPILNKFFANE